jgi:hypothetical protein
VQDAKKKLSLKDSFLLFFILTKRRVCQSRHA